MVNDLLTRAKDTFQKLRSKLSALLSMPARPQPKGEAKPKASSSSPSPKASKKK